MATAVAPVAEYENWFRLTVLIDFGGRNVCHNVLFVKELLPTDGKSLYTSLINFKSKLCRFSDQARVIFPPSGITDFNKFDVTLYTSIISVLFGKKYKRLVDDLRFTRNKQFHRGNKELSHQEFGLLWVETADMLQSHGFDITLVDDLKTCSLSSQQQYIDIVFLILQGNI